MLDRVSKSAQAKVSIITVVYEDYEVCEYNIELILNQNRNIDLKIYVVDNSRVPDEEYVSRFGAIEQILYVRNKEKPTLKVKAASFHHASGIDLALKLINKDDSTPDALIIIDPDYFVIGKEWIASVYMRMISHRLAFVGSPWGSRWKNKYKRFPCVQCLVCSGEILKKLPTFQPFSTAKWMHARLQMYIHGNKYLALIKNKILGHSIDTGSEVYRQFKHLAYESFLELEQLGGMTGKQTIISRLPPKIQRLIDDNIMNLECFKYQGFYCIHLRTFGNLRKDQTRQGSCTTRNTLPPKDISSEIDIYRPH